MKAHSSSQVKTVKQSQASKRGTGSRSAKWVMGILGVALLWTISSSNPITVRHLISTNPSGLCSASSTDSVHPAYPAICNGGNIDILCAHIASVGDIGTVRSKLSSYSRPIIISDDVKHYSDSVQCDAAKMKECLDEAMKDDGWGFEHLDSCSCAKENYCSSDVSENGILCSNKSVIQREECGLSVSSSNFPANSIDCLEYLSEYGDDYPITYPGYISRSGSQLYWNGCDGASEIRLVGFTATGAVSTINTNFNWQAYLDKLHAYNINFTRIFAVDQWANNHIAMNPFALNDPSKGYIPDGTGNDGQFTDRFNINAMNSDYFTKLKDFVTYAAKKGIIVQITLFEKNGFDGDGTEQGPWRYNPYNFNNNNNSNKYFETYAQFLDTGTSAIANLHILFINKVLETVADCGNVILEVFNEPANDATSTTMGNIGAFHTWVANQITNGTKATIRKTMSPVTNFKAVASAPRTITLSWKNPVDDCQFAYPFTSTLICWSESGYPSSPSVGELLVLKPNTPGSSDSYTFGSDSSPLPAPVTYFFSAFATNNGTHTSTKATAKATTYK